jgi:hypothetical protein
VVLFFHDGSLLDATTSYTSFADMCFKNFISDMSYVNSYTFYVCAGMCELINIKHVRDKILKTDIYKGNGTASIQQTTSYHGIIK